MEVSANFLAYEDAISAIKEQCAERIEALGGQLLVSDRRTTHAPEDSKRIPVRVRMIEEIFVAKKDEFNSVFDSIVELIGGDEPVMRRNFMHTVVGCVVYAVALPDGCCPTPLKNSRHEVGKIRASFWLTSGVLIRVSLSGSGEKPKVDVTYIRAYRGGVAAKHLATGTCDGVDVDLKVMDADAVARIGGLAKFDRAVLATNDVVLGKAKVAEW